MAEDRGRSKALAKAQASGQRCEAVYRATLAIATELSLDAVLQKIVDAARDLVKARYGALGVVDEDRRRLTRFIVSGIADEQIRAIEHWPRGLGLLGELIHFPRPLRVKSIASDPRSVGFPPHHPPMNSFLGVPILRGGKVLGNFYMTEKEGAVEFSEEDEELLSLFAAHAAIAIENARLYTETDIRLREKVLEVERAERRARFLAELGALLLRLPAGEAPPLERIAERAAEPLGDATAIYLVDHANPENVIAGAIFHRIPGRQEAAGEVLRQSWGTLQRQVIARRRSALTPTAEGGELGSVFDPQLLAQNRFSAALAVPIATGQTVYGLLASLTSRPLTLTQDDLRFALLIADRLGSAMDGATLYRKEREARAEIQKLADLAQHRASELETILDTMAEAVYVASTDMKLVRLNKAYAELVGLPAEEQGSWSIHRHVEVLKPRTESGAELATDELPVIRALRGETFTNQEVLITPIGSDVDRVLSISGAPIRNAEGEIVAAVNVARDVTEIKEFDRLRDEFISVASHELKTPLTVVKGYAQILSRRLEDTPGKTGESGMARHILEQANRMSALADRLLDVSRIQFGRLQLDKEQVDLAGLVQSVSEQMQVGLQAHTIHFHAEHTIQARIDPGRIEQVLSNLISNAAKYSPREASIDIAVRRRDGQALIEVRDHGHGIPREQQPHIFQRFFRARTGEGKPGLGLGLYVSKGIVDAHGGKIWFDSEEGQGTTFFVQLPVE